MTLNTSERLGLRKSIYALLGVGVIIGGVVFFFGADVWQLARTAVFRDQASDPPVTIGVQLFNDANQDNERDPLSIKEHLVNYADITLSGAQQYSGTTGPSGELSFSEVLPGNYNVTATLGQTELGLTPPSISVLRDQPADFVLAAQSAETASSISGVLMFDGNANGMTGDQGFEGVEIQLLLNDGVVAQTSTSPKGFYEFDNVVPGIYFVVPVMSDAQRLEYGIEAIPRERAVVRSNLDRVNHQLLIRTRDPVAVGPNYVLVQASPSAGFLVTKLGFDNDEQGVEFVHGRPGEVVQFVIEVEPFMAAPGVVADVVVIDQLPSILTPGTIDQSGSYNAGRITWTLGDLPTGQKQTLTYSAQISGSAADGYYDNNVVVSGDQAEPGDDDVTIVIAEQARASAPAGTAPDGSLPATTATTTAQQTSAGQPAPATGVGATAIATIASALVLVITTVLVAGYRRTKLINARTY